MRSFSTWRGWAGLVALLGLLLLRGGLAQENADVPDDHDRANLSGEEILLKVFDRTGGFRWTSREHWLDEDICTYEGITCYTAEEDFAGHVRELDLANNNLVGTMPEDVFQLPYLETLILRDNADLSVTFASMGGAQFLKNLVISGTSTESLAGIGQAAASLQELHLTSLGLTGPIPSEIFQLTSLRSLFANFNEFSGRLPAAIGDFFFLTDLYLYENNLGGPIPSEIGKLVNLQSLALGDNAWSGSLPVEIEQCTDLRSLAIQRSADNLKGPGLTGNLPALAQMTDLTQVDLGNQAFGGNIPGLFLASISSDKPTQVDLRGNQLNGAIPLDLSSKSSLTLLLADNQISTLTDTFCQQVPQWMGGAVAGIGCNAILCPPGTFAPEGRQTGNDLCQQCASGGTVFGSSSCSGAPATQQFERETLISMFDQMGGPYWKTSTNWLDPSANVCNRWFGVTCNNSGQVIAVRLRNNGLTKTPPADVFRLPALRILDLGQNTLDFKFDGIENAQNLQTLDLTQTALTSLSGFAGLKQTQIRKLSLGSNILNGNLPDDIFDLAFLEDLDVSHNSFSGQLSTRIGDLSNLGRLSLFGNSFVGGLPTELGRLIELTELKAGENNFNGNLPTELNNLADLEVLSLHQTTTGGAIGGRLLPFVNLQQLTSLQLAGNALTGDLPANFLQNTLRGSDRVEIQLDDNFVTGTVPNDWANRFDNLVLDLTGNRITGFGNDICSQSAWMNGAVGLFGCDAILCPSGKFNEFGRQSNTEGVCRVCSEVNVLGAKVCGSSPISPGGEEINVLQELFDSTHGNNWKKSDGWTTSSNYCSWYGIACNVAGRVTKVSLSDNGLTGTPSSSIFGLQWLQELDFGSNQITNFSFNGIGSAPTLTKLTLSSTHLASLNGLEAATSLLELHIDDNDIGGTLPTQFLALTNLERLSASYNNIVGRIPGSISSLKALSELTLFHNRFTGALPASIGTLSNLRILALSENNFDGTIPLAYNELTNLETLAIQREGGTDGSAGNVGVNQGASEDEGAGLSGPLPAFDRLSNLRNVFLGENALSGDIPDNFLAGIDSENADIVVDLTSNRLSGGIPGSLARLDKLTIFLAGNQLTETVPDGICRQTNWMFGQVGSFQCNAILCPPNTKSTFGRQTDASSACASCPSGESTPYYGSFDCLTTGEHAASAERSLLEEFYKQTNGDGWRVNDHWLDPDVSICTWHGITCNTDGGESVQSIQLMQNGLTGRVPSSVFQLPNLKELNIAENDADVSFSGIGTAQMLEFLNVDSMGLQSLDGLGQAPALRQLHAADNDFGTGFPADILLLTTIEVLFLSHNAFGTNIPDEGSAWMNLKSFSCENCAFEGFLSPVISLWNNLEHLYVLADFSLSFRLDVSHQLFLLFWQRSRGQ
jgi:Leucine-rich repeat (LRR) protein